MSLKHPPIMVSRSCPRVHGGERIPLRCILAGHLLGDDHFLEGRTINEGVLILCVAGTGWMALRGKRHEVNPGQVFFCPPDITHGYGCDPIEGWEIWWCHMQGSHTVDLCRAAGLSSAQPVRTIEHPHELAACFHKLVSCLQAENPTSFWTATTRLHDVLLTLVRHSTPRSDSDLTRLADWRVNSLDELVARSGLSKYHFSRLFRNQAGCSPWQYVLERKIERARELLLSSRLSVKEIAGVLGFPNPDYFAKLFAKHVGVTPSVYRGADKRGGRK